MGVSYVCFFNMDAQNRSFMFIRLLAYLRLYVESENGYDERSLTYIVSDFISKHQMGKNLAPEILSSSNLILLLMERFFSLSQMR